MLAILGFELSTNLLILPYEHDCRHNGKPFNEIYYCSLVMMPLSCMDIGAISLVKMKSAAEKMLTQIRSEKLEGGN